MVAKFNMGLKGKVLTPILISMLVTLVIGAVLLVNNVDSGIKQQVSISEKALLQEQMHASENQLAALKSKADILGLFMAKTAPDLIMAYDFSTLKDYQAVAARDKDVVYSTYLDTNKKSIIDFNKPDSKNDLLEIEYPIELDGELIGYVLLGLSQARVNIGITESNKRIGNALQTIDENATTTEFSFIRILVVKIVLVLLLTGAIVFLMFKKLVIDRVHNTTELIQALSAGNGDLTRRLPIKNNDEISQLCSAVNRFIEQLQRMISDIAGSVNVLSQESNILKQSGIGMATDSQLQSEATAEVAQSMNAMTETAQNVALNAGKAAEAARNADSEASSGRNIVDVTKISIEELSSDIYAASNVINEVEADSNEIGGVLDVIRGIAEQTNLLALNAAIEAARAGEQGRGFAVVADEVRTLASRTQSSTEEIQSMIERLQSGTQNAVKAMKESTAKAQDAATKADEADSSLDNIAKAVSTINDMNTQIASAASDQSSVAKQVNQKVGKINEVSQQTAESATQTSTASDNLLHVVGQLQSLVGAFKT